VLHGQTLLFGPAAPVFGLDAASRSLLLMQTLSPRTQSAEEAAGVLRVMQAMAQQWRAVLEPPVAAGSPQSPPRGSVQQASR